MVDDLNFNYRFGFSVPEVVQFKAKKGLDEEVIKKISAIKKEPSWMLDFRLKAYLVFKKKSFPSWGPDLSKINFEDIYYYLKSTEGPKSSWEELPKEIKETYERIGVPEAEREFLAGVSAQFESEVVYESIQKELARQGVIFCDMDTGLKKYPQIVKNYFGTLVSLYDNKFASLNSAVWSGGSFVYVPKGVKVSLPLQAYFRINAQNFGQFERTLIIAEEGSYVHYTEGCLLAGERILTANGWKNIESIKVGDLVFNHLGNYDRVKSIMTRSYQGKLYHLYPLSRENRISLTEEHPILAIQRKDVLVKRKPRYNWLPEVDSQKLKKTKPRFIPVSQLKKGDFVFFPKIKLIEEKPLNKYLIEFLGLYLAEGSAFYHKSLKQDIVSLSFSSKEKKLAQRCSFLTEKIIGKRGLISVNKKKNEVQFLVYSKKLYDLVTFYCGKYADEKKLHSTLINQPKKILSLFFWSYFKGDGNLSIKKNNSCLYRVSTASKQLAEQLQLILNRLDIFATIRKRKGGKDKILNRIIQRKDQYIITFTQPKRWSEVRETKDYFIVPIKKIEKENYQGQVFNLEIEGRNSYLAKGIALHNCTAPIYSTSSLHAAVVEIFVKKNARVRYTTVQNWSKNVYNLVTKRSLVEDGGMMEWIDCNLGSQITMKYPSCILKGKGARGEVLSIAYAADNQLQDAGAKMIHLAPHTSSRIISKSISNRGGRTSYRGLVQVNKEARNSSVYVSCDALILDEKSRSDTYPTMRINNSQVEIQHEATVEKIGEEKLFYLQSRGIRKSEAEGLLVNGFIEPVTKEIPLEYSIELNRLINLEMEGSVG